MDKEFLFTTLENIFGDAIRSDNFSDKFDDNSIQSRLATILNAVPFTDSRNPYTFKVHIVDSDINSFFGIRVIPGIEHLTKFSKSLWSDHQLISLADALDKWGECRDWVIEIDSMVFDRTVITFNPKEIVSMLLFQMGVSFTTIDPIVALYNGIRDVNEGYIESLSASYVLATLPLASAWMQRAWIGEEKTKIRVRLENNETLEYDDYNRHYAAALNKIISRIGSIATTPEHSAFEMNRCIDWYVRNAYDPIIRRDSLRDSMLLMASTYKSIYLSELCASIMNLMGTILREKFTGNPVIITPEVLRIKRVMNTMSPAYESGNQYTTIVENNMIALESLFSRKRKIKLTAPTQDAIDRIALETQNIINQSDKVFVLDLIYRELDNITEFRLSLERYDQRQYASWQSRLDAFERELHTYKDKVANTRITNSRFRLFVDYPTGYEG